MVEWRLSRIAGACALAAALAGCGAAKDGADGPVATATSGREVRGDAPDDATAGPPQPKACQPLPPSDVASLIGGELRVLVMMKGAGLACGYQDDTGRKVTVQVNQFDVTHPPGDQTPPVVGEEDHIAAVTEVRVGGRDGWVEQYGGSVDGAQLYVGDSESELIVHTSTALSPNGTDDVALLVEIAKLADQRF